MLTRRWRACATAGSGGLIYAIDSQGRLLRYRHTLWANDDKPYATPRWEGPKTVAVGWNGMKAMAADATGNLYAITASGEFRPTQQEKRAAHPIHERMR